MKICVAQTRPVKGDVAANIEQHLKTIKLAARHHATSIIFPELSLTGYEPELADALATTKDDSRFDIFQQCSNTHQLTIGVGMPLKTERGITIGMVIFRPNQPREVYNKFYLHVDELPYFTSEKGSITMIGDNQQIALAICYEISISEHAQKAAACDAKYYLASVAKTISGVEKASERLSEIASTYKIPVLMSNCIGPCEGQTGGGSTAVWNQYGKLLTAMDRDTEGIVIFDTVTETCTQYTL